MDFFYSRVSFCVPRLFRRSARREHYTDEEGIGSVFGAPFAVTLMCVTVKANALKEEERDRGRVQLSMQTCALALFCGIRTSR